MRTVIELELTNTGVSTRFSYEVHTANSKTFCLFADTCTAEHRSVTNAMENVLQYLSDNLACDLYAYRDSDGMWAQVLTKNGRLAGFKHIRGQNRNCAFMEIPYLIIAQDIRAA
ncbi:hypothetical protein ACPV5U_19255 [Vibrio mediterranei]